MSLAKLLPLLLVLFAGPPAVRADTLPVGTYTLLAQTTTTGIHQSTDQGTLSGTLVFSAASVLTYANLTFNDITDGLSFSFTVPGLTTITPAGHLLDAVIYNSANPSTYYAFSISTNTSNPVFRLTCGTDCDTFVVIPDSTGRTTLYEEVLGNITPAAVTPEPSTLVLLGSGILAAAGAVRRRTAFA